MCIRDSSCSACSAWPTSSSPRGGCWRCIPEVRTRNRTAKAVQNASNAAPQTEICVEWGCHRPSQARMPGTRLIDQLIPSALNGPLKLHDHTNRTPVDASKVMCEEGGGDALEGFL